MRWGHGICVACGKGGVGKTTTVANIGSFLAASQKADGSDIRVLLVDVDAQADLTSQFRLSALTVEETLAGHIRRGAHIFENNISGSWKPRSRTILPLSKR